MLPEPSTSDLPGNDRRSRLRLVPPDHPRRTRPKPLGVSNDDVEPGLIGLTVPDARHHIHLQGVTGSGKSTWLANHVLAEANAAVAWCCSTAKATLPATYWTGCRSRVDDVW